MQRPSSHGLSLHRPSLQRRTGGSRLLAAIALIACAAPLHAQQDQSAQKALAKAQFMLRQVSGEKEQLQTEVGALKQQVDQLTKQLAQTKSAADDDRQKLAQKLDASVGQWKQHSEKLSEQLGAGREQLKETLAQRAQLEQHLQQQTDNFSKCYVNNKKLYELNTELLGRYQGKGFADVLEQKEPFTGIKQVEVENLVQDYQYRLDDLKLGETTDAGGKNN